MHYSYLTKGTCASRIDFDLLADKTVSNVSFTGGCNGNLKAIAKLAEGMPASRLVELLAGNTCGYKQTSCADQFAKAISEALHASEN